MRGPIANRDRPFRPRRWWWGLVILALLIAACGGGDDSAEEGEEAAGGAETEAAADTSEPAAEGEEDAEAAGELAPLTFILTNERSIQYHPIHVAEELGYFEDEGLDVSVEVVAGSSAAMQQIIAGNGDISLPSAPAVVQAASQGNDVVWFYTYFYQNVFGLAAPTESGIEDLEGLRDKVVGVSELSGGEVPLIRGAMAGAGLTEGADYQIVPIGEGGQLTYQALTDGTADAYSSSVFDVATIEGAGLALTPLLPEEFLYMPSQGLVATREVFEERQEDMVGFARAVAKAKVWADANQEAANAIAEQYGPELYEDPAVAEAFWDATQDLFTPPEDFADEAEETMGSHYLPGWEFYLGFISQGTEEEGAIDPESVDLDTLLTDELLTDINDFDREAVVEEAEAYEAS